MIFSLIADGTGGLQTGALVALIICGVVVLAFAILGTVLKARDTGKARKAKTTKHGKKQAKPNETSEPVAVVEEKKEYDFTNLTEEEKDLIRKHRDGK